MLKNIRIGVKLLVISILLVAVPLAIVTIVAVAQASSGITKVGLEGLTTGARFVASGLNHSLQQEQVIVTEIASKDSVVAATTTFAREGAKSAGSAIKKATRALAKLDTGTGSTHQTAGLMVADRHGTVFIASRSDDIGRNLSQNLFFQQALSGKTAFGRVAKDDATGVVYVPLAAPVYDPSGKNVMGVVMEQLSIQFVEDIIAHDSLGDGGHAYVADRRGLVIAHKNKQYIMKLNLSKVSSLKQLGKDLASGGSGVVRYTFNGVVDLAGYAPVKATGWGVGLAVPSAQYLAPVAKVRDISEIVAIAAIGATILVLIFFVRSITKPLNRAIEYAKIVAAGDFTQRLEVDRRDEVGVLTNTLDDMVDRLQDMIVQIKDASEQTASSSEEISSSAQQLAEGAQNQASTLEETSASVEELTASVEQVSDHAQSQAAIVEESACNVEQMQRSVQQVSQTLEEVSKSAEESTNAAKSGMQSVSRVVDAIKSISNSSEQIAGIVNVISDIADQTNLLALNASIEAARAGEHGRGFAVVADEVSKLADRSSSSTKEIDELIKKSSKNVDDGVQIAQSALDAMNAIINGAQKAYDLVGALATDIEQQVNGFKEVAKATESISEMSQSISAATEEQTTNAKQVAKAIENVNELTQSAASAAEEMSSATEELSALAEQMQRLVDQFKLGAEVAGTSLPAPDGHFRDAVEHEAGDGKGAIGKERELNARLASRRGDVPAADESGIVLKHKTNGHQAHV